MIEVQALAAMIATAARGRAVRYLIATLVLLAVIYIALKLGLSTHRSGNPLGDGILWTR
jgi:hypothetical protein